jgi:hypothetical protein
VTIRNLLKVRLLVIKVATWAGTVLIFLGVFGYAGREPTLAWWGVGGTLSLALWLLLRTWLLRCPRCGNGLNKITRDTLLNGDRCPHCGVSFDEASTSISPLS